MRKKIQAEVTLSLLLTSLIAILAMSWPATAFGDTASPTPTATAATPQTVASYVEATISNLVFIHEDGRAPVDGALVDTRTYRLTGDWSVPDNTRSGGFEIELPSALRGQSSTFKLLDSSNISTGSCTVTATRLICVLDKEYLVSSSPFSGHQL